MLCKMAKLYICTHCWWSATPSCLQVCRRVGCVCEVNIVMWCRLPSVCLTNQPPFNLSLPPLWRPRMFQINGEFLVCLVALVHMSNAKRWSVPNHSYQSLVNITLFMKMYIYDARLWLCFQKVECTKMCFSRVFISPKWHSKHPAKNIHHISLRDYL